MVQPMKWYFEPFHLDLDNACLWQGEQRVSLRPKPFDILVYLVKHAGALVTKAALLDAIWPDTVVAEGVLATSVAELRKALGETAREPQFIATVYRRGYRFIAPVTVIDPPTDSRTSPTPHEASQRAPQVTAYLVVDRQVELDRLHRGLTAARQGHRQIIMVIGEAGIGKTTLIDAFVDQLADQESLCIGRGQCIDHYGAGEPYLPLLEAFGHLAQSAHRPSIQDILRRHAPSWLSQLSALRSSDEPEHVYSGTVGLTQSGCCESSPRRLRPCSRLLILVLRIPLERRVTLNWLRILLDGEPPHNDDLGDVPPIDAAMQDHPVRTVTQELYCMDCVEELHSTIYPNRVSRPISLTIRYTKVTRCPRPVLHHRTQGNPLFLVAMIEAFIRQGVMTNTLSGWQVQDNLDVAATIVPTSLRQLVEYHLLRLDLADQSLLEAASVVGATFTAAAVAAGVSQSEEAIEAQCQHLSRHSQFVQEVGFETWPDGTMTTTFRFIHAIYHEVVYTRISAGRQIRLHRRIAARLEVAYADHLGETAAQLAFHYRRGRDYLPALHYHDLAAQHALERSGYQEAIIQAREGLALLPHLTGSNERAQREFDLHMSLGPALMAIKGYGDQEVEQSYSRARELCRRLGEETRMFPVLWGLWRFYNSQGNFQIARQVGDQLLALAQDQDDPAHRLAPMKHWDLHCSTWANLCRPEAIWKRELHSSIPRRSWPWPTITAARPA